MRPKGIRAKSKLHLGLHTGILFTVRGREADNPTIITSFEFIDEKGDLKCQIITSFTTGVA